MSKRYDEIMAHIEVTDEMKSRILNNIQKADITASQKNVIHFPDVKKYLPIAACFALLLVSVLTLPHALMPDSSDNPILAPNNDIVKVSSIEELSNTVGYEVEIPFVAEQIEYTAYWQEMAQISYTGEGQTLIYRKSVGEEDNSGDYTDYQNCIEVEINTISVQLKGNAETFNLAIWNANGYSYSIQVGKGLSAEQFIELIEDSF